MLNGPLPGGALGPEDRRIELFDLATDPGEQRNLAELRPELLDELLQRIDVAKEDMAPPLGLYRRPRSFSERLIYIAEQIRDRLCSFIEKLLALIGAIAIG